MSRWAPTSLLLPALILSAVGCGDATERPTYPNGLALRGVWLTPKWETTDWDRTMNYLADYGINAVFVYMHSAGGAYFPSEVLPWAGDADRSRDHLALCIEAAARRGIAVHVWRINWGMYGGSRDYRDELALAGRVQRTDLAANRGRRVWELDNESEYGGFGTDFLCPDVAANRILEREAMVEVARNYAVDGVHFDYMRFPDIQWCFCDSTRARFLAETGIKMSDSEWPSAVREGGSLRPDFREWRNKRMTELAGEIAAAVRAARPGIEVSLAARAGLTWAIQSDAQDWPTWCRAGVLDFVCPMDYTRDRDELKSQLAAQQQAVGGAVPIYVGLGAYQMKSAEELVGHVRLINSLGADGFVLFDYDSVQGKLRRLYDEAISLAEMPDS